MKNLNSIQTGWFSEISDLWPGVALSLEIQEVLYSKKSKFQQIDLYQTKNHGKMLVLDGIIQLTEFDEFSYQEMMAHLPLFSHPEPKAVLVIGGGDGGVLREIGRHPIVQTIDFCEIDEEVINVSKEFLPSLACGFDDPRVSVFIEDGAAFASSKKEAYDVIIVDSSDPVGPARDLFEKPFYEALKSALKPNGLVATQGESIFLHKDCVAQLTQMTRELFDIQAYANILVPTYPGGHIGVCMGSLGPDPQTPVREMTDDIQSQLKYYSPEVHAAAFALPWFAEQIVSGK